jgi:predicted lysophospholipase L1 biosynthesis ABC-type transport system permease subunit
VTYLIGATRVDFEVRGIIRAFPSLTGPFLLTNLALLEEKADFTRLGEVYRGQREVWIGAEPGQAAAVGDAIERGEGPPDSSLLASSAGVLDTLTSDMVGRQSVAALRLNVRAVALISAAAVAVLLILAARRRDSEFGLLQVLGLSRGQWLELLLLEGATAVAVGLVTGALVGYGLARMMLPLLSRVLATAVGGDAIHRLAIDWPSLLGLYALLIAGYGLALLLLPAALRSSAPRVSGLGLEAE